MKLKPAEFTSNPPHRLFITNQSRMRLSGVGFVAAAMLLLFSLFEGAAASYADGSGSGLFAFGVRSGSALNSPYSAGSNPLIYWSELEPQQGVYNWSVLDRAIEDARAAGKRTVPRIVTNLNMFGAATPTWFFQVPGAKYYYPSSSAASKGYKAPVSWDPVFQARFSRFLSALGERYDGNPTIEFIQTNAGGGVYGEMLLGSSSSYYPAGWTAAQHKAGIRYWQDRWTAAFHSTDLSFMLNPIGNGIAEEAVPYAVSKGMFVQANSPWLGTAARALLAVAADSTRVILEVEDGGRSATGTAFDDMVKTVFGYDFPIDYLMLNLKSFNSSTTAATLPAVEDQLRSGASSDVPVEEPISTNVETALSEPEAALSVAEAPAADAPATEAPAISSSPALTSPVKGSTLPGSTVTFTWTPVKSATSYWIAVTASNGVSLVSKSAGGSGATSITLNGLPTDGKTLYVQFSAIVNGAWKRYNASYQAASSGSSYSKVTEPAATSSTPGIYSPVRGSTWPGSTVTFKWNPTPNATAYWIAITGPNGVSVVNQRAGGSAARSITLSGLPTDGKTYNVQFSAYLAGKWTRYNYSYKAD